MSTWAHLSLHHHFLNTTLIWHSVTTASCPWLLLPFFFHLWDGKKRKQQWICPITYQLTSAQGRSGAPTGSREMPRLQAAHVNSSSLHFISSIPESTPARPPPPSLKPPWTDAVIADSPWAVSSALLRLQLFHPPVIHQSLLSPHHKTFIGACFTMSLYWKTGDSEFKSKAGVLLTKVN